jgi:GntR family transcriptional regulator
VQWSAAALNKNSPIPLYYQLAELIRERIQSGELKSGDQLPSERDLSEQVAISRMTARQAAAYLVREGTLVVRHGVGTFVAEPKLTYDALHLLGFTEETMRRGGVVTSRVLEHAIVTPPPGVAIELQLDPDKTATKIVRLRAVGTTPLLLETSFIPTALCLGLRDADLATQSLYALLEQQYGLRLQRARHTLESTTANVHESSLFGVKPGTAMILMEGVTYLDQGRPVEYFKAIYRGDRFKFVFESQRDVQIPVAPIVVQTDAGGA